MLRARLLLRALRGARRGRSSQKQTRVGGRPGAQTRVRVEGVFTKEQKLKKLKR